MLYIFDRDCRLLRYVCSIAAGRRILDKMELFSDIFRFFWNYKFTLLITACLTFICQFIVRMHLNRRKYSHLPGPPPKSWIFGHLPNIDEAMKANGGCLFDYLAEQVKIYGKTFKISLFVLDTVFTVDPEFVKELFVTGHHLKPTFGVDAMSWLFGQRFLGEGLVTITNPKKWAWKRSILNPLFQKSHLKSLMNDFNSVSDTLMNRLDGLTDGKTEVVMLKEFNHVALDIIGKIAFGFDINSINTETPFTMAILKSFQGLNEFMTKRIMVFNPLKWKLIWEVRKAIQLLREFGRKLLYDRMAAKARGDYIPEDSLTYMLTMKEKDPNLDEEEILDEFVTFFVGGQETTASLMAFVVLLLGQNPNELKRLQEEIDDVIGEKPFIDYNDVIKLNYLDMVIKETLRIYPSVSSGARVLSKDVNFGGYDMKAGTIVVVSSLASSRQEENFEDPMKFNPERFSPDSEKKVDTYTYFPFQLGPRTCIGKHFADIEAKVVLAKFIQRFNFKLVEDQSLDHDLIFTLRPKDGSRCILTTREKK